MTVCRVEFCREDIGQQLELDEVEVQNKTPGCRCSR